MFFLFLNYLYVIFLLFLNSMLNFYFYFFFYLKDIFFWIFNSQMSSFFYIRFIKFVISPIFSFKSSIFFFFVSKKIILYKDYNTKKNCKGSGSRDVQWSLANHLLRGQNTWAPIRSPPRRVTRDRAKNYWVMGTTRSGV